MVIRVGFIIFALFVSLLLLCNTNEAFASSSNGTKPKPFEFLNHLKGCHKGETLKGVHNLKLYLKKFGYLDYDSSNNTHADDDDEFDEVVESAVKTYQTNYNLKATGTLDTQTVNQMTKPRCGVPDVINGRTSMRSGKRKLVHERHHHKSSMFHTVSHYSFFPGSPRWPNDKTHLTYAFDSSAREDIRGPCAQAFQRWSSVTHFTFEEIQDYMTSDLKIGFHSGDHGDGYPFDGTGGTLAHAFSPTDGRFHYDADENWSNGPVSGSFDLETVALHEIGHLLGLGHSSVEGAIMYSGIPAGVTKDLHGDDVEGIRVLYGR